MTKTYRNTVPEGHMFMDVMSANECIGSVTNLYFPEALYMNFSIAKGWGISLAGGWYHISNGSTRQPNSGYNIFAGELALKYDWSDVPEQKNVADDTEEMSKRWSIS
jgi:hypothetical protein